MASSEAMMQYDAGSVRKFEQYFVQPPKKRGRPKKKKRGRPKKMSPQECDSLEKQTMMTQDEPNVIDLTFKELDELDARLEGTIRDMHLPVAKKNRINWDSPKYFELRKRFADSWTDKNDLFKEGESFTKYVKRCDIDRNVLKRYMKGKYITDREIARDRKTLLPVHVMRHLIEGIFLQS